MDTARRGQRAEIPADVEMWRMVLQAAATQSGTATTTQRRVAFVPEQHTDFIFAVVPENVSILEVVLLVALIAGLIYFVRRRRRNQSRDAIS